MFSNDTSKAHSAQILSCSNIGASTWFIVWPIFLSFWLSSPMFCTTLHTRLKLPHLLITGILQCVHTSHQPYGYPLLMLYSWQQTHWNPWCNLRHLCHQYSKCWFPCGMRTITCTSFNHIQLISSMDWHCVYQKWHSLFSRHCHCRSNASIFTSPILCNSRICCIKCSSKQGKELL